MNPEAAEYRCCILAFAQHTEERRFQTKKEIFPALLKKEYDTRIVSLGEIPEANESMTNGEITAVHI